MILPLSQPIIVMLGSLPRVCSLKWKGKVFGITVFIVSLILYTSFPVLRFSIDREIAPTGKILLPLEKAQLLIAALDSLLDALLELQVSLSEEQVLLQEKYRIILNIKSYIMTLLPKKRPKVQQHVLKNKKEETEPLSMPYSCPESFKGTSFGYPLYQQGFVRENCTMLPIKKSTTILQLKPLTAPEVKAIAKNFEYFHHGISIYCIVRNETFYNPSLRHTLSRFPNVKVFLWDSKSKGFVANQMVMEVNTKFILVLTQNSKYVTQNGIERMIRVLTRDKTERYIAVGSAVRDELTGHWQKNCFLFSLKLYTMKVIAAYKRSFEGCLQCDFLSGPFLARKSFISHYTFSPGLNHSLVEDLFIRLWMDKREGNSDENRVAVACPDIMFVSRTYTFERSTLEPIAKTWYLTRIIDDRGKAYLFVNGTLSQGCPVRGGMAVPPYCLKTLSNAISEIMEACQKAGAMCELQEGTLLGAVKFENVLPWERDGDIAFLSADFSKVISLKRWLSAENYRFVVKEVPRCCVNGVLSGGVVVVYVNGWNIQLYGQHQLDSFEAQRRGEKPTTILFAGKWINTPYNPGLYARNRYGKEIYKHAEHWTAVGMKSSWEEYRPGRFQDCEIHGHHACLNQHDADGTVQFLDYYAD